MARYLTFIFTRSKLLTALYVLVIYILTLYPFSFNPANNVKFLPDGGAHFSKPATMYTDSFPLSLSQGVKFTLLLHIKADADHQQVNSTLISNSFSSYDQNFFVRQLGSSLQFRVFTGNPPEQRDIYLKNVVTAGKDIWCAIVHDGEKLYGYINGLKKNEIRTGVIDCSTWNRSYPLVFGSEANGYWNWEGTIYAAAFFHEAADILALQNPDSLILARQPELLFRFTGNGHGLLRSRGSDSLTALNVPERFVPYRRTFLMESTTQFWKRRIFFRDVLFNIVLFLPLGFLISVTLSKKNTHWLRMIVFSFAAGLLLSLSIESLQTFLPERISSISDVLSNSAGAVVGGVVYFFWQEGRLRDNLFAGLFGNKKEA